MSSPNSSTQPPDGVVERLLARLDRLPLLGGGRTHLVALALFFAVSFGFYLIVLKLRGPASMIKTWIAWDRAFPFTPWWTLPYLLVWGLGPLLVMLLHRETFAWYLRRGTIVTVVSIVIFALVPTQTIRPLAVDNPERTAHERTLGEGLLAFLYRSMVELDDPPANAAPSLHVSLSCLLAWAIAYERPRWWPVVVIGAVLVWLSTLYTAQHHLVDVVTGALLASLAAIGGPRPPVGEKRGG